MHWIQNGFYIEFSIFSLFIIIFLTLYPCGSGLYAKRCTLHANPYFTSNIRKSLANSGIFLKIFQEPPIPMYIGTNEHKDLGKLNYLAAKAPSRERTTSHESQTTNYCHENAQKKHKKQII